MEVVKMTKSMKKPFPIQSNLQPEPHAFYAKQFLCSPFKLFTDEFCFVSIRVNEVNDEEDGTGRRDENLTGLGDHQWTRSTKAAQERH